MLRVVLPFLLLLPASLGYARQRTSVDSLVTERMGREHIAGLAAAVIDNDFHLGFLTWFLDATSSREIWYGHEGGDIGVRTYMGFNPRSKRGIIVLTNSEAGVKGLAEEIVSTVLRR